jgi:alkylated DNA repair protein (DNA oxidative demethylase)
MTHTDPAKVTMDLFPGSTIYESKREQIGAEAFVLRGFAQDYEADLIQAIANVTSNAPFRHMVTPGGFTMSVAMTNCGSYGWVSDRKGYRYSALDPVSQTPWPAMPASFLDLSRHAAAKAGFVTFASDACLVNCYEPGSRLSLHQDKDELDFDQPIVSVSLGVPAVFLFGGLSRKDKPERIPLFHGDVVVWGGADRLRYHGILPLKESHHPHFGKQRINLTFRKAV